MTNLLRHNFSNGTGQNEISQQRPMPTEDGALGFATVSGRTVPFFYYNSTTGVLTADAGQAAGTIVVAFLGAKIMSQLGDVVGSWGDTSFSFGTGTILTRRKAFRGLLAEQGENDGELVTLAGLKRAQRVTEGFSNGDYCIDHSKGVIYGVKATTGTSDTVSYKLGVTAINGSDSGVTLAGLRTARTTGNAGTLQASATGANFAAVRIQNGGTAQYFQVHNDADGAGLSSSTMREIIWLDAYESGTIIPQKPEEYGSGIFIGSSSTGGGTYTAGATDNFIVCEYSPL